MVARHDQAAYEELCGRIEVVINGEDPDKYSCQDFRLIGRLFLDGQEFEASAQSDAAADLGRTVAEDSFPRVNGVRIG